MNKLYRQIFLATFLVILLPIFGAVASPDLDERCVEEYTPLEKRYKTGLLFEIVKCEEGYKSSYIFGTMHSDSKALYKHLQPAYAAMKKTTSANFEVLESPEQALAVMKLMYYSEFSYKTLETVLGKDLYNQLKRTVKKYNKEMPEVSYARMRPWAAAVLLQYPKQENDGLFLDLKLEKYSERIGVPKYGLETVDEQMKFFLDLSEEESVEFLKSTLDSFESSEKMNKLLKTWYIRKDLYKMQELAEQSLEVLHDQEFQKKFKQALIIDRNERMFERVQPRLKEGAFIAVGALHLPWDYGLLKLFENADYRVYISDAIE